MGSGCQEPGMCLGERCHASAVLAELSSTWEVAGPPGGSRRGVEAVRNGMVVA